MEHNLRRWNGMKSDLNDFIKQNTLLTPEQTSKILGVQLSALAAWRSNHRYDLKFVKVGRLIRYRAADVVEFISKNIKVGTFLSSRTSNNPNDA